MIHTNVYLQNNYLADLCQQIQEHSDLSLLRNVKMYSHNKIATSFNYFPFFQVC